MQTSFEFDGWTPDELLDAFEQLPAALRNELNSAADDIGVRIASAARENAPVDRGRLRSSISHVVESVGNTLVKIRVGSNVDQAAPQEFGTDPGHFPPISALRGWARRVLGDESAAYPIARSIAETGLDAQPFLEPALRENIDWAMDRINDAVTAAFEAVGFDT